MEKSACQQKNQHPARGQRRRRSHLSISGVKKTFRGRWGVLSITGTFTPKFQRECTTSASWKPQSSAAGKSSPWGTTFDIATTERSEKNLFVGLNVYTFVNIIHYHDNRLYLCLFTPSRCGRRVDYKFYNQLEQILGQEAVSLDEYDERDEQTDQDPGAVIVIPFPSSGKN